MAVYRCQTKQKMSVMGTNFWLIKQMQFQILHLTKALLQFMFQIIFSVFYGKMHFSLSPDISYQIYTKDYFSSYTLWEIEFI